MPPTQSKNLVMKTKSRKIPANNAQMPMTQRHKVYSELPMVDIQNTRSNIPTIDSSAQFSKDLISFFPDDLEQSFHLGLLAAGATFQHVSLEEGLTSCRGSDKIIRPENKSTLQDCIQSSDLSFGKYALDCKDPIVFSEQNTHHFMKDGKVHQTYLSRKSSCKTEQQHLITKRFLKTHDLAEDIAYCQTNEKSTECEDTGVLPQRYENDLPIETDKFVKPEHCAIHSKLFSELEPENISALQVLSKKQKHVTFADEVTERQTSESENFPTSDEADFVKFVAHKPKLSKADEHPAVTSDWNQVNQSPENLYFSDPPFPSSQKYGNHEIVYEDWKLMDQDDLLEVKLYEDRIVQ